MLISYYANKKSFPRLPSWQPSLISFNTPIDSGSIIKPCTLKHFQVPILAPGLVNIMLPLYWHKHCFIVQVVLVWRLSDMVKVGEMNVSITVAWMVFPVNCVAMGFLRYGQRDISLYHFGVNTIFCTLCDDVAYRQMFVSTTLTWTLLPLHIVLIWVISCMDKAIRPSL